MFVGIIQNQQNMHTMPHCTHYGQISGDLVTIATFSIKPWSLFLTALYKPTIKVE